jgi:hypothetical protein
MERELTDLEEKKLKAISRRIMSCAKELDSMNLKVYLNASNLSIMDGSEHMTGLHSIAENKNQLYLIPTSKYDWDGGDW